APSSPSPIPLNRVFRLTLTVAGAKIKPYPFGRSSGGVSALTKAPGIWAAWRGMPGWRPTSWLRLSVPVKQVRLGAAPQTIACGSPQAVRQGNSERKRAGVSVPEFPETEVAELDSVTEIPAVMRAGVY